MGVILTKCGSTNRPPWTKPTADLSHARRFNLYPSLLSMRKKPRCTRPFLATYLPGFDRQYSVAFNFYKGSLSGTGYSRSPPCLSSLSIRGRVVSLPPTLENQYYSIRVGRTFVFLPTITLKKKTRSRSVGTRLGEEVISLPVPEGHCGEKLS